jgi:predicted nucleic acid-binding protein
MILADTSVWVSHLRQGDSMLHEYLLKGRILIHPFIVGEIACGNLRSRSSILSDLGKLPLAAHADDIEVLGLVEEQLLYGKGIGWVDAHLLASARLTGCRLWTLDLRLSQIAHRLGVG